MSCIRTLFAAAAVGVLLPLLTPLAAHAEPITVDLSVQLGGKVLHQSVIRAIDFGAPAGVRLPHVGPPKPLVTVTGQPSAIAVNEGKWTEVFVVPSKTTDGRVAVSWSVETPGSNGSQTGAAAKRVVLASGVAVGAVGETLSIALPREQAGPSAVLGDSRASDTAEVLLAVQVRSAAAGLSSAR